MQVTGSGEFELVIVLMAIKIFSKLTECICCRTGSIRFWGTHKKKKTCNALSELKIWERGGQVGERKHIPKGLCQSSVINECWQRQWPWNSYAFTQVRLANLFTVIWAPDLPSGHQGGVSFYCMTEQKVNKMKVFPTISNKPISPLS